MQSFSQILTTNAQHFAGRMPNGVGVLKGNSLMVRNRQNHSGILLATRVASRSIQRLVPCDVKPLFSCLQENVAQQGLSAMNLTLDFDEVAVLQENMTYLHNTLEVSCVVIPSFLSSSSSSSSPPPSSSSD